MTGDEFTTIVPGYQKFIEWQITTLKEKGRIIQGSHPIGWCPSCKNPVSQHDTMGDVEPKIDDKNFLIKFKLVILYFQLQHYVLRQSLNYKSMG